MMADTDETTTLPVKDSDDMISQEGTSDQVIGDEQEGKSKPKAKQKVVSEMYDNEFPVSVTITISIRCHCHWRSQSVTGTGHCY